MRTTTGGQTANSKRQTTNAMLLPRPHAAHIRLHFSNTNTNAHLQRGMSAGGREGEGRVGIEPPSLADVEALSATRARFVARGKRSSARCVAFLDATATDAVRFCVLMKAFSRWDKSLSPFPPSHLSGTRVDWGNKCIAACGMQLAALTADLTFDSCIFHSWWHSFFYL